MRPEKKYKKFYETVKRYLAEFLADFRRPIEMGLRKLFGEDKESGNSNETNNKRPIA